MPSHVAHAAEDVPQDREQMGTAFEDSGHTASESRDGGISEPDLTRNEPARFERAVCPLASTEPDYAPGKWQAAQ